MPWLLTVINEHFTLSFSNRYLTPTHLAQDQPHLDPDLIIDACTFCLEQQNNLGYLEDNQVLYYEQESEDG